MTTPDLHGPTIIPWSPESVGPLLINWGLDKRLGLVANTAWPAANRALAVPFTVWSDITVVGLFALTGAATGNIDLAIYDESFNRLVSTGSFAATGALQKQTVSKALTPGKYYMAIAASAAGAGLIKAAVGNKFISNAAGMVMMNTAFPLPDPLVPAAMAAASLIPVIGLLLSPRTVL